MVQALVQVDKSRKTRKEKGRTWRPPLQSVRYRTFALVSTAGFEGFAEDSAVGSRNRKSQFRIGG